ncbi:MAG TPA: hypothetical protein VMZ28_00285 [Kofleriaceae bacterium]|nr:hypothetical protein [Kofleriaceae bacterium]
MIQRTIFLVVLSLAAACGKDEGKPAEPAPSETKTAEQLAIEKENAAPAEPKTRPASPKSDSDVDLTFSGAFSATLKGKAGSCSLRKSGPIPGATWQVRSEELAVTPPLDLTIIAEPKAFQNPTMIVNLRGDRTTSYARPENQKDAKLVLAEDATSAEVDVELVAVVGGGKLRVAGSIRCSKPSVFE